MGPYKDKITYIRILNRSEIEDIKWDCSLLVDLEFF